jgi:pimeloyl-ACP methyl ester carboxylesterase
MLENLSAARVVILFLAFVGVPSGTPAGAQSHDFTFHSELAEGWFRAGEYFSWTSTTANNNGLTVKVHYRTFGDRADPALVLLHGYPTSSFDFREMIEHLEDDYFIATLDFPGFGFSDKPQDGYSYMLEDDAKLVDYFVREIVDLDEFSLFTHDRGVSVGLAFLGNYLDAEDRAYELTYHFLSNSGMFLPLANLLDFQKVMLHPVEGPAAIERMKAQPRRTEGTAEQVAYADIQAFNDGIGARLGVGKYLLERAANEYRWLDNLARSPVPVAYIWGLLDPVNPIRIANHVWDNYLNEREEESSYWIMPMGRHYPQRDHPAEMAKVIRLALEGRVPDRASEDAFMWSYNRSRSPEDAIFVGHSDIRPMQFPGAVQYTPSGYN